jgi:hypothetical protein
MDALKQSLDEAKSDGKARKPRKAAKTHRRRKAS